MPIPQLLMAAAPYVIGALAGKKATKPLPTYQPAVNPQQMMQSMPKAPAYQSAPAYKAAPTYNGAGAGSYASNLQSMMSQALGRLNSGQTTLSPEYRAAVMGTATRSANDAADEGAERINHQLNQMGLLNSTAQGRALGENERTRQSQVANARDDLTEQEFALNQNRYGQLLSGSQNLLGLMQSANRDRFTADRYGHEAQTNYGLNTNRDANNFGLDSYRTTSANNLGALNAANDQQYRVFQSNVARQQDSSNNIQELLKLAAGLWGGR